MRQTERLLISLFTVYYEACRGVYLISVDESPHL